MSAVHSLSCDAPGRQVLLLYDAPCEGGHRYLPMRGMPPKGIQIMPDDQAAKSAVAVRRILRNASIP
jgi:hypothetical protein